MEEHPTCGLVFGGYRAIDGDGDVFRTVLADLPEGLHRSAAMLPILFENCLVTPPTALVRTSAYAALGAEYRDVPDRLRPMAETRRSLRRGLPGGGGRGLPLPRRPEHV